MIVVGITGGIGSGKTTVAGFFRELGVPVFIADLEAKKIMETSQNVKNEVRNVFGDAAFVGEQINRQYLANRVFEDKQKLEKLNNIIHPAVTHVFENWKNQQKAAYVLYEAAILFEKGSYKKNNFNILVTSPKELRIQRTLKRDHTTRAEIEARMSNQWEDSRKIELADFIIENIDLQLTKIQVQKIHKYLLSRTN